MVGCGFGNFATGTGRTLGRTVGSTRLLNRACINDRRLLLKLLHINNNITSTILAGCNIATRGIRTLVHSRVNYNAHAGLSPSFFAPHTGRIVRLSVSDGVGSNGRLINDRRLLLKVLNRNSGFTVHFLGSLSISITGLAHRLLRTTNISVGAGPRGGVRDGGGSGAPALTGCKHSLARSTGGKGVSPIVKHRDRIRHIVRVLYHHAGGGPYLINRPNINGATVVRKLTRRVYSNGIPRVLRSGQVFDLSLANVITNAGCHNSFRRQVGTIVSRIAGSRGVILFVSRVRAVVNTNSTRKSASTTGVLGPSLTHNRFRLVNTAALARCHGGVRGSSTLRHHFRPMAMGRPSRRSDVLVLGNVHSGCRTRRGIAVASRTVATTIGLSSHCVASHFLPSGTVSLVSRTSSGMELSTSVIPRGVGRLRRALLDARSRGRRTVDSRDFRGTTGLHSRMLGLGARLRSTHRG